MTQDHGMKFAPHMFWWLVLPLVFYVVQIAVEIALDHRTLLIMHSEGGPHESLQFFLLIWAFVMAVLGLCTKAARHDKFMTGFLLLAAFCCFYVGGEEVSWGQHIIGWNTPDFWLTVNDQQETNLHNTSSWFDQKPRLLLEIAVMVGGIAIPLTKRFKPSILPPVFKDIYPPSYLFVIALIALTLKVSDWIGEAMGYVAYERVSEVIEVYLYWFIALYLAYIYKKLRAESKA
jgi:hypothetical protein